MTGTNILHHGHCLCGDITFEAKGSPRWVAHCHCESCRRQTASAVATFVGFLDKDFRYLTGTPQVYESSPQVWRSFCGRCGTPLTYRAARFPDEVHVFLGALDRPASYPPEVHVHFNEHLPWFDTRDELPRKSPAKSSVS